jgi:hypothetical protein
MLLGGLYIISLLKIGVVAYKAKVEENRYQKVKDKYEQALYHLLHTEEDKTALEIEAFLGVTTDKLKSWEKAYITDLLVHMTKGEYEV